MENAVTRRIVYGGSLLFCLVVSFYFVLCEKVPINNGFGWDGAIYADLLKNFDDYIATGKINSYYIKRVLPAILVSLPSRIFNIPVTPSYIVNGFVVANILNLVLAVIFWLKTAVFMRLSTTRTVAGFMLLFVTFPVLKYHSYLPVLTDSFAFSTAMMMMYCYLRRYTVGLVLLVFFSSFIWAGTLHLGLFLLCFSYGSKISIPMAYRRYLPVVASVTAMLVIVYTLYVKKTNWGYPGMITPFNWTLFPLSLILLLSYVFWCSRRFVELLSDSCHDGYSAAGIGAKSLLTGFAVVVAASLTQKLLSGSPGYSTKDFLTYISWGSVKQPLIFLVASITYYASVIAFLILNLKNCLRVSLDIGFGFLLAVTYGLALGVGAEPRFYINILPFIVLAVVLSGAFDRLGRFQWVTLIVLQLLASKVWLQIGASVQDLALLQSPGAQRLFMSIGLWMSDKNYVIHLCAAVALTGIVWLVFCRKSQDISLPAPPPSHSA